MKQRSVVYFLSLKGMKTKEFNIELDQVYQNQALSLSGSAQI